MVVGCSAESKSTLEVKESKETTTQAEESDKEEIAVAPREIEGMVVQEAGKLVKQYIDPELEIIDGLDFVQYRNFIEDTFEPAAEKQFQAYFEKNQELTSDQVYDYLVDQLGSGQYKTYYESLRNFEHGHVMPDLPDGADEIEVAKNQQTNVVILMDASGSMKAAVSDGVKMELAKETIMKFTDDLQEDVNVSLLAYGHIGTGKDSDKENSCKGIETLYPLGSYNSTTFNEAMNAFQASGWTPLAGAIEKANELLSSYNKEQYKNIVYIISDGIETCDGNPIEAAQKLNDSNIEAKVHIIGFDVDDEGQKQLKDVAEAGGGEYTTVRDKSEFEDVVLKKWRPNVFQLLAIQGIPLHEVVNQKQKVLDLYTPMYTASEREANRIISAVYFLKDQKLISEEAANHVITSAEELRDLRNAHFKTIKEEKDNEAQQARDEIDAEVQAWKEKWNNEL